MKPIFKIIANQNANQNDITDLIAARLITINITDETGLVSDLCEILLDNRDQKLQIPATGVILEVLLGYEDQALTKMGSYVVDDIELSSPPEQMRISGKATNSLDNSLSQNIRSPQNKSWHGYSLVGIISAIANNHGFKPAIDSYFKQIYIEHLDQTAESDISFLNSLAKDYGAFVKLALGRLLFFRRGISVSESGLELPTIKFTANQISNWQLRISDQEKFNRVIAKWHNFATGREEEVSFGQDINQDGNNNQSNNSYIIRYQYTSSARALGAAKAKLAEFKQAKENLSFTTIGNPNLSAENNLIFTDVKYLQDKNWIISRVNHAFSNQGFTSEVNAILKIDDGN